MLACVTVLAVLSGCGASNHKATKQSTPIAIKIAKPPITTTTDALGYTCPKTGCGTIKPAKLTATQRRAYDLYRDQIKCADGDRACLVAAALKHATPTLAVDCSQLPSDANGFDCLTTRRDHSHVHYDVEATRTGGITFKTVP